jgi:hypothetical protein
MERKGEKKDMDNELVLDNSGRQLWRSCHQKYYLQVICGLRSVWGSTALRYGSTWHAFLEGFYSIIKQDGWGHKEFALITGLAFAKKTWDEETAKYQFNDDYRSFDAISEGALKYLQHFAEDEGSLKIIGTEKIFEVEMTPLTLEEVSWWGEVPFPPRILFTGKIDLQVEMFGSPWIWDAKTTGNQLSIESARLHRSAQLMGYSYGAAKVLDFVPNGTLISFFHTSARKNKDGVYGTIKMDFARTPHIFTDRDLEAWRKSYLVVCKEIWEAMKVGVFDQCQDSCYAYNHACSYSRICEQNKEFLPGDEIPEGFMYDPWDVRKEAKKHID